MLIRDIWNLIEVEGQFGVEIEVEGRNLPATQALNRYFNFEHDGSLRGESMEYVFKRPMDKDEAIKAITMLYNKLEGHINADSPRTGVHVHLNIQNQSVYDLIKFYTLYLCVENVMVRYCGKDREGNLFCLRSEDAEWSLFNIRNLIMDRRFPFMEDDNIRYSSLNLNSIPKYGSVEFRSMRTPGEPDKIIQWIELIECINNKKDMFDNPHDIVYQVSNEDFKGFVQTIFEDKAEYLNEFEDEWEELIKVGVRNAQLIAFCIDDWAAYQKEVVQLKKKKRT